VESKSEWNTIYQHTEFNKITSLPAILPKKSINYFGTDIS